MTQGVGPFAGILPSPGSSATGPELSTGEWGTQRAVGIVTNERDQDRGLHVPFILQLQHVPIMPETSPFSGAINMPIFRPS